MEGTFKSGRKIDRDKAVSSVGSRGSGHVVLSIWSNYKAWVFGIAGGGTGVSHTMSMHALWRHAIRSHAGSMETSKDAMVKLGASIQIR